MESTFIPTVYQKDKGIPCQKDGGKQGRSPSSFCQKATSQPTSPGGEKDKENELEETISPKLQDSKDPKRCHGQCVQYGQNFDGIQGQRRTKNETTPFPKEKTLTKSLNLQHSQINIRTTRIT
ncbi:hypothetical protein O181_093524 [Austropuccinia psidii MF-1]|uniref:Uncharacterized protein n=1 Tax=Austropuccinia psidii MF-1 TaxID=1389203 RepID=A0A9Q3J1L9_9BASI|nr:hypothetical protein [Austropuccinia psidii MF-1]